MQIMWNNNINNDKAAGGFNVFLNWRDLIIGLNFDIDTHFQRQGRVTDTLVDGMEHIIYLVSNPC